MKVFEKIDMDKKNRIEKINKKIEEANKKINKFKSKLTPDIELDDYTSIYLKIKPYEEFIKTQEELIQQELNTGYTEEEKKAAADEVKNEFNPKMKKAYDQMINSIKKVFEDFDKYDEITKEFIKEKKYLDSKSKHTINLYCGDNSIKYDKCNNFRFAIERLKRDVQRLEIKE